MGVLEKRTRRNISQQRTVMRLVGKPTRALIAERLASPLGLFQFQTTVSSLYGDVLVRLVDLLDIFDIEVHVPHGAVRNNRMRRIKLQLSPLFFSPKPF